MIELTGYQILDRIYSGTRTLVYRGTRLSDQKPVAIKVLRNEYPTFSELLHFRNQYTIAKNLNLPGIIQTYSLEAYQNGYALIVEDFGGISLKEWTGKGKTVPSLVEFFQIAIDLCNTLDILSRQRIIHKDIKPANILINPETKQVKLIDFSIASLLPRETQTLMSPNVLEGTLSYLSPEQTGRMNRGLDYRTDFYSLGVTFYELLTGKLPFQSNDPMELIHCHIAKQPPSVREINLEIPLAISEIVSKLMAKNAENRYQSALGTKADLETCLQQLNETGKIESFAIGRRDVCDRFIIPEKLYGRETEVAQLLAAFDRVANPSKFRFPEEPGNERNEGKEDSLLTKGGWEKSNLSRREMMLVAGFSGIGKTVVVNEVHKPIVRQRGYFIKGKYDQFQRNIPFSAFVQAFRELMEQLLSESDVQLQQWQIKIQNAVADNGQVIVEVIPELERIIGKQQPVSELLGSAAENRFNLVFQKFISVFATKEHPLVIFLDDLQWSDSASLKLLQVLMSEKDSQNLLVIGAYRDNEVSPVHPFMLAVAEMEKAGTVVNTITLQPLSQADINDLIADTLSCDRPLAQPLTELVYQKTKGNPFFATQFLKSLQEDGLIAFNSTPLSSPLTNGGQRGVTGGWQCDIAKVKALTITSDVVEFMALQLQKLPPETQDVLKLAACIGSQFDLNTLAVVSEKSPEETAADLWKSLQEGFILPTSEIYKFYQGKEPRQKTDILPTTADQLPNYKFLHDRIQQAAYSLIPEDRKQATHLKIGQLLLQKSSETQRQERIFDIVGHFNFARGLICERTARYELASLNLQAGKTAKAAAAFDAALIFVNTGISSLPADSWQEQYTLTLALHNLAAEAAYLCSEFEQMEQLITAILQQANQLIDKVSAYEIQILAYLAQGQPQDGVYTAIDVLGQLGIRLPKNPTQPQVLLGLAKTKLILGNKKPEQLVNLPNMTDANKLAAMRILSSAASAAYLCAPKLMPLLVFERVNLSVLHGNTALSAFGYAWYGLILCGILVDIEGGYQFGQLSLQLLERFNATDLKAKVLFMTYTFISHWRDRIADTMPALLTAYQSGLETGDVEYAAWAALVHSYNRYWTGENLTEAEAAIRSFITAIAPFNQKNGSLYIQIYHQATLNLMGDSIDPSCLSGESYRVAEDIPAQVAANDRTGLFFSYVCQQHLNYLFGQYDAAIEKSNAAKPYFENCVSSLPTVLHFFYDSLAQLAIYATATSPQRQQILKCINANQEKLKKWGHYAPMNYQHKFLLVEAERYRVLGQKLEAIDYYDRAIQLAKENQFLNEEALANELAAKFYLDWSKEKVAAGYMQEAYYCYARWGAKAKTDDLEKRYPDVLRPILQQSAQPLSILETLSTLTNPTYSINSSTHHSTSNTSINHALDFSTLLQISQVISSTIDLDELLQIVTQTMLQNSGADRCALMLCQDRQWEVRAIATWGHISLDTEPLENNPTVPVKLIQYVKNTLAAVVIDRAKTDLPVIDDYLEYHPPESLLGLPILNQGNLVGILYLENRITSGVFSPDRLLVLNFLSSQAAIALENARLYHQLQQTLNELQQAQIQMIQSEKMSALGNLVAGVAHEINNPVGFIAGNLNEANAGVQDLIDYLHLYQEKFPQSGAELIEKAEEIDLDYLVEDLPKMLTSMKIGCDRIKNISTSLRTFSRADTVHKVEANIHEGLDSTLMILRHRLKANEKHPEIQIIKKYGKIPKVKCYLGQLNQVFMNLLANAIDALEESNQGKNFAEIEAHPNQITIRTKVEGEQVKIAIADNGNGMPEEVKNRIFDHLFTTKDVGKGTGLGLAIARQIVEEKHGGKLSCISAPGEGTEFVIEILID
ncbi:MULTISPECIES: AAA family ATPase [unclassified Microcoleus]|uniref:AAA family ATPase n=1 Tax=unclassified Microcoleus TaxID=2642155 RepID=UPI002FD42C01